MHTNTCVRVFDGRGRGGGGDWEPRLRLTLAIAESYWIIGYTSWIFDFLSTTVIGLLQFVRCDFKPWHWLHLSKLLTGIHTQTRTRAHARTHTHTSGWISLNFSLKCSLLSCSCQWSVFTSQWRVGLWSLIVVFPGHTHFFDQTRTHLALTFTFVGIALHSLKASFICTIYTPVQIYTRGVNLHLGCILVI